MNKITSLLLMLTLTSFYPSVIFAEEPVPEASQETPYPVEEIEEEPLIEFEGAEFSYGTVKSASPEQIVVTEYDYENDKDIDVTYSTTPETTYDGVESASQITAGDAIDIDYELKGEQKVALAITIEKMEEGEELELDLEEEPAAPAETTEVKGTVV